MNFKSPEDLPIWATPHNSVPAPATPIRGLAGPIPSMPTSAAPQTKWNIPAELDVPAPRRASIEATKINWAVVNRLRGKTTDELNERLAAMGPVDAGSRRQLGLDIINRLLNEEEENRPETGGELLTAAERASMAQALSDAVFGYGRLQPLLDDDTIENIMITGSAQNVWVERASGELERVDPIADSDEELVEFLQHLASTGGLPSSTSEFEGSQRTFSSAHPTLHMRLEGGARLAAAAWVTAGPNVVIRRHRLRKVTLDDLVERKMMTADMATFLRAAIRAGLSIVVSGPQGGGKTTVLRALCAEIPPYQVIGTFETEFELMLHELKERHPLVIAWESRPGSSETGVDGHRAGEFELNQALRESFRFNNARGIVGEVRGPESWAMLKAMESGAGSMSTTHAPTALMAIEKLVTCAMEAGTHVSSELATRKIVGAIDLIVQIQLETHPLDGEKFRRERWINEIVAITRGENDQAAHTFVYKENPAGGPAIPGSLPDHLLKLERFGFDLNAYLQRQANS